MFDFTSFPAPEKPLFILKHCKNCEHIFVLFTNSRLFKSSYELSMFNFEYKKHQIECIHENIIVC